MNLENFLSVPVAALRGVVFTPVLMLVAVLSFLFLLVFYHWSGLAEKVENLTPGKKFFVFIFIALVISVFYYIFYKAGKFDKILSYPLVENLVNKGVYFINLVK